MRTKREHFKPNLVGNLAAKVVNEALMKTENRTAICYQIEFSWNIPRHTAPSPAPIPTIIVAGALRSP
jgi:hypothetical protein